MRGGLGVGEGAEQEEKGQERSRSRSGVGVERSRAGKEQSRSRMGQVLQACCRHRALRDVFSPMPSCTLPMEHRVDRQAFTEQFAIASDLKAGKPVAEE